jgi:hypothetical protein
VSHINVLFVTKPLFILRNKGFLEPLNRFFHTVFINLKGVFFNRLTRYCEYTLWTPKVGKCRKSLTNPGSGGKSRNFIIPFVRKRLILALFYSVLFTLAMWNWNKEGFACNIVKGRTMKQRVPKIATLSNGGKSRNLSRFRPLLAGIIILRHVFRPLLFIVILIRLFPTRKKIGIRHVSGDSILSRCFPTFASWGL